MAIGRIPEPGTGIPESIVDAKGDIVTATAADTPARLAVGTNEHRLVAASGETTGLKYVADTTNYAVAAKGDLLVGTAADTLAPLTVGTDGYTLVADSVETTGLKWVAPSAPSYSGCQVFNSVGQNTTSGTYTVLNFNSETYDIDGYHSTATNTNRLTVPTGKAGYFYVYAWGSYEVNPVIETTIKIMDNNGNEVARASLEKELNKRHSHFVSSVRYLADAAWVEVQVFQNSGTTYAFEMTGTYGAFGMFRIGA